ncbi:OB-fold nucleic acid binding domain-containing protein [Bradyrhizobium oligotrophicum]|uniref:OB-fold nucleic acid binding domain-containing protein n=1 Tax=Bradyrhizobium oligotrophicum TaxID=44255 RepID=UPI003EBC7B6A
MRPIMTALLLAAAAGLGAQAANAQAPQSPPDATWDASQLPETRGIVKQYTLTPRGDVDGLILNDGTEVKLPPHLTAQVVFAIRPGDAVSVRGLRARAIPLVDATAITNIATGKGAVDNGPPDGPGRAGADQTFSGRITALLHGKRGEVNGAVLDDGTQLRLPPPEAERLADWLRPGQTISVRGNLRETALGKLVEVDAIGASPNQLTAVDGPRPPRGPDGGPDRLGPPPPPAGPDRLNPPPPPRG